jgi:hypothetical protein
VDIWSIPQQGIVFDGHDILRASARDQAAQYLRDDRGWTPAQAEDATAEAILARAWWAGPDIGFCGEGHPQAQAVSVLNIANSP